MRETRRQIEHVAGCEVEGLLGFEVLQDLERHVRLKAQVALPADRPSAVAVHLQQEDVVAVEMRADAAAVARVADHQIVEPRIGQEAELLQQRMRAIVVQVDALHQQRPAGLLQRRQRTARERAVLELPALRRLADQARFDVFARCKVEQRAATDRQIRRIGQRRHGLTDE